MYYRVKAPLRDSNDSVSAWRARPAKHFEFGAFHNFERSGPLKSLVETSFCDFTTRKGY